MAERRQGQYDSKSRDRARELRSIPTAAEDKIWFFLRNRHIVGTKFRRQHPFGPYFLDFYCHEHRLVVEIDGGQHVESAQKAHDDRRTRYLQAAGLRVLRFNNIEALLETEAVLGSILEAVAEPSPNPLPGGEG